MPCLSDLTSCKLRTARRRIVELNRRPARRQVRRERWQPGSHPSTPEPSHGRELAIPNWVIGSLLSSYFARAQFQSSMQAAAWNNEAADLVVG